MDRIRIGVFLCAICLTTAFAFEKEFLGLLENELKSATGRVTREAPARSHHHHHWGRGGWWRMRCCGDENSVNMEFVKESHEEMRECFKESNQNSSSLSGDPMADMYSCDKLKEMKRRHICIAECAMKKKGTINDDGIIDVEKVKELSDKVIAVDWMKEPMNAAVEKCASSKERQISDDSGESKCNPAAINFKHCVWKELIKTCPEDHQLQSKFCDKIRTALKENENKVS